MAYTFYINVLRPWTWPLHLHVRTRMYMHMYVRPSSHKSLGHAPSCALTACTYMYVCTCTCRVQNRVSELVSHFVMSRYGFDLPYVYLNVSCLIFWSAILENCTENGCCSVLCCYMCITCTLQHASLTCGWY